MIRRRLTRRPAKALAIVGVASAALLALSARPLIVPVSGASAPQAVTVTVGVRRPLRPISPLIYGVDGAGQDDLIALGATLNRWGGNTSSRYNWELGNAFNAARDWEFRNGNYGNSNVADHQPSSVADRAIATNQAAGVESFMTIPALGWVAKDDNNETRSLDVPRGSALSALSSGLLTAIAHPFSGEAGSGYDPATNQSATSVRSLPRKEALFAAAPDLKDQKVYQDEWVNHLVQRFGTAGNGGVRFYAIDNEPDLWSVTHTDVHPAPLGYDELLNTFVDYATAVKDVDPEALVLGPALSGWLGYFHSPRDVGGQRALATRVMQRLLPGPLRVITDGDRRSHGNMDLLPWWLDQVRRHDQQAGRRTLDVLDVHYYPQADGVYSKRSGNQVDALRLRSTRSLWDPTYVDESWIKEPVRLIPRLREWIDRYYPGTLLSIGEWNWGAEQTMNGALAVADVLGIYGREGVDLAAYWTFPAKGSPAAQAFRLYTNYDGHGSAFGDVSLPAASSAPNDVTVYASRDSATGDVILIAIAKRVDGALPVTFQLDGLTAIGAAHLYRYSQDDLGAIHDLGERSLDGQRLTVTLPPSSATVLRVRGSGGA